MKIIHCFFTMRTGGAQLMAIDMLNSLSLSQEVGLIIINDGWDKALLQTLHKNVAIYYLNRTEGSRNPLPLLRFNGLLHQLKPDIIHCHERKLIQLIRYKRAKTVYTVHDVNIPAETFVRYDALVAISQAVAMDVHRRIGLQASIITNGVPLDSFRRREMYDIRAIEPIRLVQVSRLMHEKKGQDILLRALAKLVGEGGHKLIRLDLIGDGPSLDYLTKLAKTLRINTLVSFRGERDRTWITRHLADYHLLIQPSRYEGFGLTVVEGFAAGLPVVASDVDGPAEIMAGLPAGTLFASGNVDACADALAQVINAYRTNRIEAAVLKTYPLIGDRFSMDTTVTGYLNLYNRLLQQSDQPTDGQPSSGWRFSRPQQHSV